MKIQSADESTPNIFTAYGDDYVCVNSIRHEKNIIVINNQLITDWTCKDFDSLTHEDVQQLVALDVEVILLGTGKQLRFLRPELMQPLAVSRKGIEVMDIHAACRTYNLLTSEKRKVAAALLFS